MDPNRRELIRRIHGSPVRMVIAAAGGGSQAIAELLVVPGASRTILEAVVPYAAEALYDFLRGPTDQHCSEATARAMAMAAWMRAQSLTEDDPRRLAGVGLTASLATDRPKRGEHRLHVALHSAHRTEVVSLTLTKGERDRAAEEAICSHFLLQAVARACAEEELGPMPLGPNETMTTDAQEASPRWQQLMLGDVQRVGLSSGPGDPPSELLFPGAFNPLHDGHRQMVEASERLTLLPLAYEVSVVNVDKPALDYIEIDRRVAGLENQPVWLTRAATFRDKAKLFPGATFVVGADTLRRIADPSYYSGDALQVAAAIDELRDLGSTFLVFGRVIGKSFCTLEEIELPAELRELCRGVPEEAFREDVSSSEVRRWEVGSGEWGVESGE